jgi:hypothetical protein
MLEYRLCLLLQLWCLTSCFVCRSIDFASFYNCDDWRSCICMLEYRLCLLLQLWCLTVRYLYVGVSSLPHSTIAMIDGHVFVCWSIDFASFYNCDVWRSCICMLEYRLCLLLQLWWLTVMYLYVRVSTLSPSTIVMFDVMYLYVRVSTLPPSTIVMFDGHVFVW